MAIADLQKQAYATANQKYLDQAVKNASTTNTNGLGTSLRPKTRPQDAELNRQNSNGVSATLAKSVAPDSNSQEIISALLGSQSFSYDSGEDNPMLYGHKLGKELVKVFGKNVSTPESYYTTLNANMMDSNSTLTLSSKAKKASDMFISGRTSEQTASIQEFLGIKADGITGKETQIALANYRAIFGDTKLVKEFPYPTDLQSNTVRSIRNNNPGNIDRNKIKWEGMADDQKSDSRFVVFKTPELGARAMAKVLRNYQTRYNLNTVSGIISRWAPPSENNTKSYTATVAKAAGVTINQTIDIVNDKTLLSKIMTAMIKVEGGNDAVKHFTPDVIKAGIELIVEPNNTGLRPKPRPANLKVGVAP